MGKDIVLYHNDLTDSDNWAATSFLASAAFKNRDIDVIWIVEPRQVSLGLSMSEEQISACIRLLEVHFPSYGDPYKALRGGYLQRSDLDNIGGLTEHDRKLLEFAIKPAYGPKEDARLHGRLVALDFVNYLTAGRGLPVNVFLDVDALDDIENPMNLNLHYHEELVPRSKEELESYRDIMNEPHAQRVKDLRGWYKRCIESLEKTKLEGHTISNLDLVWLCEKVKAANSVKYFGGASLGFLQRLIRAGAAGNVQCCLQAGAFDVGKSLFNNQFNIALNVDAARFVFSKAHAFKNFSVVPAETAKRIKYSLSGLSCINSLIGPRCLGFNRRVDPMKLATEEVTVIDFYHEAYTMPDLTAFLCGFCPSWFKSLSPAYARLVDTGSVLTLQLTNAPGIRVYTIPDDILLAEDEFRNHYSMMEVDGTPFPE
ncbi:hypothetical protein F5Y14DRAFT_455441 [Nemania sp. NC0429]|nr:hypothetical protein F5Y14DRAFT_455441 [Nemania sp. NC0429]